jgi:hypothetical protein
MERVKVKAAPGLTVIDPSSGFPLPAEGKEVNLDTFWFRRLEQGDCVRCEDAPPAAEKTSAETKRAVKSPSAAKEKGGNEQ